MTIAAVAVRIWIGSYQMSTIELLEHQIRSSKLEISRANVSRIVAAVVRKSLNSSLANSAWISAELELTKSLADELDLFMKSFQRAKNEAARKRALRAIKDSIIQARAVLLKP